LPQPENPATHQPVTQAMRDRSRWHRRTGRGTLRIFRPLFAPFLTRLQSRLQTAIEQSPELRRIEAKLDDVLNSRTHVEHHPALGGTVVSAMATMRSGLERMQAELDRLAVRIDLLQIATDGSTLDRGEFHQIMIEVTSRHRETLDASHALQADLPRLLDQLSATHLRASRNGMSELIERVSAAQAEKLDRHGALLHESHAAQAELPKLSAQVSALRLQVDRQHTLLNGSRTGLAELIEQFPPQVLERLSTLHSDKLDHQLGGASTAQAETLRMTNLLMSRSDRLLQRIPLPLAQDTLLYTPYGYMLLPVEDPVLVSAVWESGGRLEPGTTEIIVALLREGDTAIDVGANVGLTVLPAARRVGPTGQVIAIEPGSRVAGVLRQTLELNFLADRVSLHHCAAGEAEGTASLNIGPILGHSSLLDLPHSQRRETVEVRTVDSLVPQGTRIRLAKVDVEGFEPHVWRGMRRVIAENPELAVLVEFGPEHLTRAGLSVESWFAEMLTPDFTAYEVAESTGQLRPLRAMSDLAGVSSLNLLLLRQPATAFPELCFEQT